MPTAITITAGDSVIPAILNDTVAAQDFKRRMPFKVSGHRSDIDYCCSAACGRFDPAEIQAGWKNGDVSLFGGWFAVLFDGEEESSAYQDMMIIAHIDESDLDKVKALPQTVSFTVKEA